jgi:hypothetical protein
MVTATEMEWHDRMVPSVFYFCSFFGATAGFLRKVVTAREIEWKDRMVSTSF